MQKLPGLHLIFCRGDQNRTRGKMGKTMNNEGKHMTGSRCDRRRTAKYYEIALAGCALAMLLVAQWILSSVIMGANYFGFDGKMAQSVALTAFKFSNYLDVT